MSGDNSEKKFLDSVYDVETSAESQELYSDWSATYDAEVAAEGYATPKRLAEALAAVAPPGTPVLDYGCGTGLSGVALKMAGFSNLTGFDITPEMVEISRQKQIYNKVAAIDADTDPPISPGDFGAIVACGVIGAGAAPPTAFDQLMHALGPGGILCFSYNDHTLKDRAYMVKISEWVDCGAAALLSQSHGDHLPGRGIKSTVFVLQKR